jgi:hypothetical protein
VSAVKTLALPPPLLTTSHSAHCDDVIPPIATARHRPQNFNTCVCPFLGVRTHAGGREQRWGRLGGADRQTPARRPGDPSVAMGPTSAAQHEADLGSLDRPPPPGPGERMSRRRFVLPPVYEYRDK